MLAYVLVQAEASQSSRLAREIGAVKGVVSAMSVSGPYDVIALVEGRSLDELSRRVVLSIQHLDGIVRTITCPAVKV